MQNGVITRNASHMEKDESSNDGGKNAEQIKKTTAWVIYDGNVPVMRALTPAGRGASPSFGEKSDQ